MLFSVLEGFHRTKDSQQFEFYMNILEICAETAFSIGNLAVMSIETLSKILDSKNLQIQEIMLFQAILSWASHQVFSDELVYF
jgi:hypothetical protein